MQSRNDLLPGSREQLVLIDLEIHFHALSDGLLIPPAVTRKVYRILPPVHRSQILLLLGLFDYCELHGNHCTIFQDHQIWHLQDRTLHDLPHGTYVRVIVPPPDDTTLDTQRAIAISRDFALEAHRPYHRPDCQAQGSQAWTPARPDDPSTPRPYPQRQGGDDNSLFQHSIQRLVATCGTWQPQWQPEQLKVAPDQVVHPTLPSGGQGHQQRQPLRPRTRFHDRDFDTLSNLFESSSIIECEEEGPIAYVDTWYIHHANRPQCRDPRAVRLIQDPASWLEDLLEPWSDVIDPDQAATIYLVRPTPPCTQMECLLAHLIIEQAPRLDYVVGLISIHEANFQGAIIDHRAFSLPSLMTARSVIRQADIQARCSARSCTVRKGAISLDPVDPDHVDPGTNFVIFIRDQSLFALSSNLEHDEAGLMQRLPELAPGDAHEEAAEGAFAFNPNAPVFCPGQAPLNVQPETIQELHEHWSRTAFSWEAESASTSVLTWFVDQFHPHLRTCRQPRIVRLYEDFDTWERTMRAAWNDLQLPGAPILFHIVLPVPPHTGPEIAAHVLLVQNPQDAFSSSVISVFEANAAAARLNCQLTITTQEHLLLEHLIFGLGLEGRCLYPGAPSICEAWIGTTTLRQGQPHPARDGDGIILQLRRRPNFQQQQAQRNEGVNLLQVGTQLRTRRERRLTHGLVAHTHGPPQEAPEPSLRVVHLARASQDLPFLPSYVEVQEPLSQDKVREELQAFGIHCTVLLLSTEQVALCLASTATADSGQRHVAYLPQQEPWTVHLHTLTDSLMSEVEHMRHLYGLGYEKAVILQEVQCEYNFSEIHFTEVSGAMRLKPPVTKVLPPWPAHQQQRQCAQMFYPSKHVDTSDCSLNCGVNEQDLLDFFNSSKGSLCTSFEDLDMPEICTQHFATLAHHSKFDRLVIYVDGSSQARCRHIAPQLNDEIGTPDAWCFIVIGETYTSGTTADFTLIGWSAHQVRCCPDHDWYAGADRIGSAIAEREALFWAMMWRIGQNSNIPTLFRSDSMLALQQARGEVGSLACDLSFQSLRGCAQLLEAALAPGDFLLEHVPGHAGDPFNEFCDWGAKKEGSKGFYLKRPNLDFANWRPLLPFLWMLFDISAGMPPFHGTGFDVRPPALPSVEPPAKPEPKAPKQRTLDFVLSIATGNVLSLGQGPAGFTGKLDYLRAQLRTST